MKWTQGRIRKSIWVTRSQWRSLRSIAQRDGVKLYRVWDQAIEALRQQRETQNGQAETAAPADIR